MGWPAASSLIRAERQPLATDGPRTTSFAWASVSKMAVAALIGIRYQTGEVDLSETLGPDGATISHLLSHSSGLGPTRDSLRARVGAKRIYSTFGYELLVERLGGVARVVAMCQSELGLSSVESDGSAGGGLRGSLHDLEELAWAWLGHSALSRTTVATMTSVFLPSLAGVLPGFGSYDPCPWGLGPQVKGSQEHWMGSVWPSDSFGHFGQSGSLLLIDPQHEIAVVALSTRDFGSWALETWRTWTSDQHESAT